MIAKSFTYYPYLHLRLPTSRQGFHLYFCMFISQLNCRIGPRNVTHPLLSLSIENQAQMQILARQIAASLSAGDVVLLDGPLAAGKTFLVREIVIALGGMDDEISSPTYTIANIYDCPAFQVLHVDAWRLHNAGEFHDLGLEEICEQGLALVEWGSKVQEAFDMPLQINISLQGDTRKIDFLGEAARWRSLAGGIV